MHPEKINKEKVSELGRSLGHFQVNLPDKFESYQSGNGEGCWAVALNEEDREISKYEGPERRQFYAYLANESLYYPHLEYGSRVLAETRGENRCVAVWDGLVGSEDAVKNKEELFEKLKENKEKD